MKEKIVLMKSSYGSVLGMTDDDVTGWEKLDWVVISEPVEVDFPELSNEVIVNKQIAILDKQFDKNLAECEVKNNQIIARKQKLLALDHDTGE